MTASAAFQMTVLDTASCMDLLRSQEVGRLAVSVARHPDIFPINYVVDGESIVFRTAEGTKLAAAYACPDIAFEIDGYDSDRGEAWSVVIKGQAEEISMYDLVDEEAFELIPWSPAGTKSRFVRLRPETITGRRFHVVRRRGAARG